MVWGIFTNPWALEVASLLASTAQLIAIVAILGSFDGRPIFDGSIITLNTVISVLSTGFRASVLTVMASCISQASWLLFSGEPRRLHDFEMLTEASRGPLGSLKLLWSKSFKKGWAPRLGALVTILTIAADPFAQQLVKLQATIVPEEGGELARALRYSRGSMFYPHSAFYVNDEGRIEAEMVTQAMPDFAMQAAIMFGLTAREEQVLQQTSFSCPGAACDFTGDRSLSVCSKCESIDSSLKRVEDSYGAQWDELTFSKDSFTLSPNSTEYRLPNGLYLNNRNNESGTRDKMVLMTMAGTHNRSRTVVMDSVDTLIWAQSMIKVDTWMKPEVNITWPDFGVHATECALYYCVKEYNLEAANGTVHHQSPAAELDEYKRSPDSWKPIDDQGALSGLAAKVIDNLAYHPVESCIQRSDLQLSKSNSGHEEKWNISQEAVYGISSFAQSLFADCIVGAKSNCTDVLDDLNVPNGFYQLQARGEEYPTGREEFTPSAARILWESRNISSTFETIAASMSNALRTGDDTSPPGKGRLLKPVTVYWVDWGWIALHGLIMLFEIIFFIIIVWSTSRTVGRVPVWKSSELAVLSRGTVVAGALKDSQTLEDMEKRAMKLSVRLIGNDRGDEGLPR